MEAAAAPVEQTWDLTDLYADDDAFGRAKADLERRIATLDRWRGELLDRGETLADALEGIEAARKNYALLRSYASLKSDLDTRVAARQAMREGVELLGTTFSKQIAWLRPELLAAAPERIEELIASEPRLAPFTFFLRDLMRYRPHVLAPGEEGILAEAGLLTRTAGSLFEVLTNVDLPRPELTLSGGETIRVDPVTVARHRSTPVRDDRRALFRAYFGAYAAFRETLGHNLFAGVKSHLFRARVRRHDGCLEAALFDDNVPVKVYHGLIAHVREHLPLLGRYFELRRRALGLERLEYTDLHCPLTRAEPRRFTPDEAQRLLLDSLEPLGDGYKTALTGAFGSRWVDWHPAEGKRPGAYSSGWAYDHHPFVLMNFVGDFESVSTLAHEMGHAMHSHFSNLHQPFATADYSIFVAEVASTLNENLLSARAIELADDREQRLFLLASYLDGIRATLFRQTMFAEFELRIHEAAERGEVLTGEAMDALYLQLLRDYHGGSDGVLVDDAFAVEWAAIPHFHYDFYVYQYATGIVAATALAEAILANEPRAQQRYAAFLSSGGSAHPLELLRRAGVDLETAQPYRAAFAGVARKLDQLEELLDGGLER